MMTAEQKAAWLSARCGKLTASRMADAMFMLKSGEPAKARTDYLYELLAERMTGNTMSHYVTDAMQWGIDKEDEAADRFVALTGRDLRLSRFYEHPQISNFGATPDREIDDFGIEIKCPTTAKYIKWKLDGIVPVEHRAQMLAQMACTGWKKMGFVAYDPRIKEERHQLFLANFEPTPQEVEVVENAARKFLDDLEKMWELLTTGDSQ